MTHQVNFAPPVSATSTIFIAASIDIIEIKLIPNAVFNADINIIFCRIRIIVSKIMLVKRPLHIARSIIDMVDHGIPVYWKYAIVPKSPIEHPIRHHFVLLALLLHVCLHFQSNLETELSIVIITT